MNLYYLFVVIVCVLAMITMCVHVQNNTVISNQSIRWFIATFLGIALVMIVEFLGVILDQISLEPWIHRIVTLTEFSVTPLLPIFLSLAVGVKKPIKYLSILVIAHVVIELVMLPFGGIYYISSDGFYHRGQFYLIYIICYGITYIYLMLMFLFISKKFSNRDVQTLICIAGVIMAGLVPSLIDGSIRTAFLGVSLAAVLIYSYYEDLSQQDLQKEIDDKNTHISDIQMHTISGMANLIESRDGNTGEHVKNTARYVEILGKAALREGIYPNVINQEYLDLLIKAAPMHDVGKIVVPDHILNKPGRFDDEEFEIMKQHAAKGGEVVKKILDGVTDDAYTQIAMDVATYHHEKWNGTGYPKGLVGEDIPIAARIMAIADVYDALVSKRVYKASMPKEKALAIISQDSGSHFDPILGPLFVKEIENM